LLQSFKNLAAKKPGGFIFLCFVANSSVPFFYFPTEKRRGKQQEKGEEENKLSFTLLRKKKITEMFNLEKKSSKNKSE